MSKCHGKWHPCLQCLQCFTHCLGSTTPFHHLVARFWSSRGCHTLPSWSMTRLCLWPFSRSLRSWMDGWSQTLSAEVWPVSCGCSLGVYRVNPLSESSLSTLGPKCSMASDQCPSEPNNWSPTCIESMGFWWYESSFFAFSSCVHVSQMGLSHRC